MALKRRKRKLALSTRLAREHEQVMKRTPPGEGGRFASLREKLARKGARTPAALAAWIGRRKYGKARFQKMAAKGRRKS